jgi:predicted nucleotidyltransferase
MPRIPRSTNLLRAARDYNEAAADWRCAVRRDEVMAILSAHRQELEKRGVASLDLFGSVARDEARPDSDVDLLVEFNRAVGLFAYVALERYLSEILGRPVELVTPGTIKPRLRDRILREAVHVPEGLEGPH